VAELIAVSSVKTGWAAKLRYAVARIVGAKPCPLMAMTHGLVGVRQSWEVLAEKFRGELGHTLQVVSSHDTTDDIRAASVGREPCVLIRDADGGVSMIADWNDIQAAAGNLAVFDRILRSKLLMY